MGNTHKYPAGTNNKVNLDDIRQHSSDHRDVGSSQTSLIMFGWLLFPLSLKETGGGSFIEDENV